MKENFGAINVQLTKADMSELDAGFAKITIEGKRVTGALMAVQDIGANFGTSSNGTRGNSPLRQKQKKPGSECPGFRFHIFFRFLL
jgi:hypothetical protein